MNIWVAYLFLFAAVVFGTASNSFANSANGYTKLIPSVISIIAIVLCMFSLSNVMKVLPVGITYASFAGVCIIATSLVGVVKFNQTPNIFTLIGLILIIIGVLVVNLFGQN
jgi:small multidrug resistance pump